MSKRPHTDDGYYSRDGFTPINDEEDDSIDISQLDCIYSQIEQSQKRVHTNEYDNDTNTELEAIERQLTQTATGFCEKEYILTQLQKRHPVVTPTTAHDILERLRNNYNTKKPRIYAYEAAIPGTLFGLGVTRTTSAKRPEVHLADSKWRYDDGTPFNTSDVPNMHEIPSSIFNNIVSNIQKILDRMSTDLDSTIEKKIHAIEGIQSMRIVLDLMHNYRVSIVGMGGSGKTTLLKYIVQHYYNIMTAARVDVNIAITGPTHEAVGVLKTTIENHLQQNDIRMDESFNICTIHSFLGMKPSLSTYEEWEAHFKQRSDRVQVYFQTILARFERTTLIVMDEGSLLNIKYISRVMEYLCNYLIANNPKYAGRTSDMFGNKLVLLMGDPLQLPPVGGQLVYLSSFINGYITYVLDSQLRTKNMDFAKITSDIRIGNISNDCRLFLQKKLTDKRWLDSISPHMYIFLSFTNKVVNRYHQNVLEYYTRHTRRENFTHKVVVYKLSRVVNDDILPENNDNLDEGDNNNEVERPVIEYEYIKPQRKMYNLAYNGMVFKNDECEYNVGCRVKLQEDVVNVTGHGLLKTTIVTILDYTEYNMRERYPQHIKENHSLPKCYSITVIPCALYNILYTKGIAITRMLQYVKDNCPDSIFVVNPVMYSISAKSGNNHVHFNVFALPVIQCNSMTIHKSQSCTFKSDTYKYVVIHFAKSVISKPCLFYTAISRLESPDQLKIYNEYGEMISCNDIKTNMLALSYIEKCMEGTK